MYSASRPLMIPPQSPVGGITSLEQGGRYPPGAAAAAARQYDIAQQFFSQHTAAMAKLLGKRISYKFLFSIMIKYNF